MEIVTLPAEELKQLISDYKQVAAELIEAKRELAALKDDTYVTWDWVCAYFGIDRRTAKLMLAKEKIFVHNKQIKRLLKSSILRFAERHSVLIEAHYTSSDS